jgi:chromate reductase
MEKLNVSLIVGSVRKESINIRLSKALERAASGKIDFKRISIDKLPMFNQDLEQNPPAEVTEFKAALEKSNAIIFISPEYNRTIPPLLKNAIDWGSRPYAKNSWKGKRLGIMGASPGSQGTVSCQLALRATMGTLDCKIMGQPEAYVTFSPADVIDADGKVNSSKIDKLLENFVKSFIEHCQ